MNCPNCSKEISDTAKVCGYCGTRLAEAVTPTSVSAGMPVSLPEPGPEPEPEPEPEEPEPVAEPEPQEHKPEPEEPESEEPEPLSVKAIEVGPSRSSRSWMIWVPLAILVVGAAAFVGIRAMLAEDDQPGTTIAQATTTEVPVTTAAVVTTSPPTETQPTIASTTTSSAAPDPGFPLLSIDALVGERLALLDVAEADAEFEQCEVVGQFELQEGPVDGLECRREATAESGAVYVAHGFYRDEADTVTDVIDRGMWFTLAIDGIEVEPDGFLDRDGAGDPVVSWVFFLDLSGSHELVAAWYDEGFPTLTTITEVLFP